MKIWIQSVSAADGQSGWRDNPLAVSVTGTGYNKLIKDKTLEHIWKKGAVSYKIMIMDTHGLEVS